MRKIICLLSIIVTTIALPKVFAQTTSNSDFDPFPQMEQDQKSTDEGTAPKPDQQDDEWPPANAQANSDGAHD